MTEKHNPEDYRLDKVTQEQAEKVEKRVEDSQPKEQEPMEEQQTNTIEVEESTPDNHPWQATTAVSNLPSRGVVNPYNEVRYKALSPKQMTALYSSDISSVTKTMRNLLQECTNVDILDMLRGDLVYLYLQIRKMSWKNGDVYKIEIEQCPNCRKKKIPYSFKIDDFDIVQIKEDYEEPMVYNVGDYTLQLSYLKGRDEQKIETFVRNNGDKFDIPIEQLSIMARFAGFIDNVNDCGNSLTDRVNFLLNLGPQDSEVLTVIEAFADEYFHGIDWEVEMECPSCEYVMERELDLDKSLIYPKAKDSVNLNDYR